MIFGICAQISIVKVINQFSSLKCKICTQDYPLNWHGNSSSEALEAMAQDRPRKSHIEWWVIGSVTSKDISAMAITI